MATPETPLLQDLEKGRLPEQSQPPAESPAPTEPRPPRWPLVLLMGIFLLCSFGNVVLFIYMPIGLPAWIPFDRSQSIHVLSISLKKVLTCFWDATGAVIVECSGAAVTAEADNLKDRKSGVKSNILGKMPSSFLKLIWLVLQVILALHKGGIAIQWAVPCGLLASLICLTGCWWIFRAVNQPTLEAKEELDDLREGKPQEEHTEGDDKPQDNTAKQKSLIAKLVNGRRASRIVDVAWSFFSFTIVVLFCLWKPDTQLVCVSLIPDLFEAPSVCDSVTSNWCKAQGVYRVMGERGYLTCISMGFDRYWGKTEYGSAKVQGVSDEPAS